MLINFSLYRLYHAFLHLLDVSTSLIRNRSPNSRGADNKGWYDVLVLVHTAVYTVTREQQSKTKW